ncbi:MAG: sigma-54-dependent Fis family transcriptional regulator [Acidobacteria bacterium]|nr:sigma-54-dependent Fis family transcriptional regulator [Acidobacteriota bacterium]
MSRILVIDDDLETCRFLAEIFQSQGWEVDTARTVRGAVRRSELVAYDCIVSDIRLDERRSGLDLLKLFRKSASGAEIVLISGFGSLEIAVEAVQEGAFDFISKPFQVQQIISTVSRALDRHGENAEGSTPREGGLEIPASGIIGRTPQMVDLYKEIARVAPSRSTVLLIGESGTGKELIARSIHQHSRRSQRHFVAINCGALTETLLESELFGHVKGSFTGAIADKKGYFEEASGGTLLLDEISETTPALQVKLLRVLQEGEIKRVGDTRSTQVDVRVIAATNRDLEDEAKAGRFREDLFYRLSVVTLRVPPLRERRDDIPLLARHFLRRASPAPGRELALSSAASALLTEYAWPGNVRELENTLESAALHARGGLITTEDLPARIQPMRPSRALTASDPQSGLYEDLPSLDELQKRYLLHVLKSAGGNRSRAAEILGVDRRTLYRMAERFQIDLETPETSTPRPR